ncbi:MAG: hypothetical protein J6J43_07230 [Oscillospiraceae bacterium]|nr:hypothetical protein [Oscillospiraceae bacterium]
MREALQPGTVLQLSDEGRPVRLQILEFLGDGSTCICYLAQDMAGRRCRIKEYFPLGSTDGEGILERDPESLHVRCIPGFPEQAQAYGRRLVLSDVQAHLDQKTQALQLPMLRHLFAHPLYEHWDGGDLRLLVLGAGNAAQSFLDAALPLSQNLFCRVHAVAAAADAVQAKAMYLAERPAFHDFFDVDGEAKEDAYGALEFKTANFYGTAKDEPVLQALIEAHRPHYLFIAVGEDRLCRHLAKLGAKLSGNMSINYVLEERKTGNCPGNALLPEDAATDDPVTARLDRMAQNVHLLWHSRRSGAVRNEKAKNLDTYHHEASLAAAVSIPYKFRALGLSYDCPGDAAKYDAMLQKEDVLQNMIWSEHRRWCAHKLCSAYVPREDFDACVQEMAEKKTVNDTVRRRHLCVVKSRPGMPLSDWSRHRWDTAGEKDLAKLDPLDRVSVRLHQAYVRAAKKAKTDGVLSGTVPAAMAQLVRGDRQVNDTWFALYGCLSRIWMGDEEAADRYEPRMRRFQKCFRERLPGSALQLEHLTDVLRSSFDPMVRSLRCMDYKQNDLCIVKGASFVSTYRPNLHLAAALPHDGSRGLFAAACAAVMLDPAMLTVCDHWDGIQNVEESVQYLQTCFERRSMQTQLTVVLGAPKKHMRALRALAQRLRQLARVRRVELLCAETREAYEEALQKLLASMKPDAVQQPELPELSVPGFTVDVANGSISCGEDFPLLLCTPWRRRLLPEDLSLTVCEQAVRLPVVDHPALESFYEKDPALWRRCCKTLAAYAPVSAVFDRQKRTGKRREVSLLLHSTAAEAAMALAELLKEHQLLTAADFGEHSFGFLRLHLQTDEGYADAVEDLFTAEPSRETPVLTQEDGVCTVCLRPLMVDHMILPEKKEEFLSWLEQLYKLELIARPRVSGGTVSFHYNTWGAKRLMTYPEQVRRVCAAGCLRASGRFDRVFDAETVTELSESCDLLATAGLRSYFICVSKKPTAALRKIVKQHGICPTIVCIEKNGTDTEDTIFCRDLQDFLKRI